MERPDTFVDLKAEQLAGGISQQAAHVRLPGQVADAENVLFSVADGIPRRPGTILNRKISSLLPGGDFKTHPIERDESEKYDVIFGKGASSTIIRVMHIPADVEATVTISPAAQKYLDFGDPDSADLRLATIGDTTFIVNRLMPIGTLPSTNYSITGTWRDYGIMTASTPVDETYHLTTTDDDNEDAGHWQYDVDGVTFSQRTFGEVTGSQLTSAAGIWDNTAGQPYGFKIGMQRRGTLATLATFTAATNRLIGATGSFAEVRVGEFVFCKDGQFGGTGNWYEVVAWIDAEEVELGNGINTTTGAIDVTNPASDSPADVSVLGLGGYFSMSYSTTGTAYADMYAVAAAIQQALRDGGAQQSLVAWTETGFQRGKFTITSSYRGSGATFFGPFPPGAGTDLTAVGYPFNGAAGAAVVGTGTIDTDHPDTLAVDSRWNITVAPNQPDAQIDAATMPVQMVRTIFGSPSTFEISVISWDQRTTGDQNSNPSPSIWQAVDLQGSLAYTAASPTVCTSANHGLTTGDTIAVVSSGGIATIDGIHEVSVTGTSTFTIAVDASAGGGNATWRKGGLPLADIASFRGRLWLFAGENSVASQSGDFFDFYIADYENIVDSDPIDKPLPADKVAKIDFVVPIGQTLIAYTLSGLQFELSTPEALTASTASWTQTTRYETVRVRPCTFGPLIYSVSAAGEHAGLLEYLYDDFAARSSANNVAAHVRRLLPTSIRSLAASATHNLVFALPPDDGATSKLYVYRPHFNGNQKIQSAWTVFVFDAFYRVHDIAVIGSDLWMLVESTGIFTSAAGSPTTITAPGHGLLSGATIYLMSATPSSLNGSHTITVLDADTLTIPAVTTDAGTGRWSLSEHTLERLPLQDQEDNDDYPYRIHLDRQVELLGVHAAGTTTWTLPIMAKGSTINRVVLRDGTELALTGYGSGGDVSIAGNYSSAPAMLGRNFSSNFELTRPFVRDRGGRADIRAGWHNKTLTVAHVDAGPYDVDRVFTDGRGTWTDAFAPPSGTLVDSIGEHVAHALGNVTQMTISIEADSARPLTITGIQWEADEGEGPR